MRRFIERGPRHVLPLTVPEIINNEAPANVAKELGIKGFALTAMTACTSGTAGSFSEGKNPMPPPRRPS